MSLTATTLSAAVDSKQTQVTLTSGTGVAVGNILKVDDEKMLIQDISLSPTVGVLRGYRGSAQVAHDILAPAVHGTGSDFTSEPSQREYSYGQDGAITVAPGKVNLTKATAGAYTLADPTQAQNGLVIEITSRTNAAHVITGVTIHDGTTGVHTTLTFAAYIGASITLRAENGKWNVISANAVTAS